MISIRDNESIHSYFIQHLLISGALNSPSDLLGIVSPSGVVYSLPILGKGIRKYFPDLSSTDMKNILEKNAPHLYTDKTRVFALAEHILQESNEDVSDYYVKGRTQLRYCIQCAKDQLKNFGYSCFFQTGCTPQIAIFTKLGCIMLRKFGTVVVEKEQILFKICWRHLLDVVQNVKTQNGGFLLKCT